MIVLRHYKRKPRSKYRNVKTAVDGITFDSKREAKRYNELKLLKRAGLIKNLELQKRFVLLDKYENGNGEKIRSVSYVCDFFYKDVNTGEDIVEDVKGQKTQVYNIKKKWFEAVYYPLTIKEI